MRERLKCYLLQNCFGKRSAVSAGKLRRVLHLSEKELRDQIHRLRLEGVPIGSGPTGYFYARTADEVCDSIALLEKMRDGLNAAIDGMKGSLRRFSVRGG